MDTYVFTFLRWRSCTSLPYSLEEGNDRIYTGKSPQIIIAMLLAIPLPSHQTTLKSTENPPGIHSKVSSAAMTPPSGKSPHIITAILLAIPLPSPLPSSFPPGGGGRGADDEGSRGILARILGGSVCGAIFPEATLEEEDGEQQCRPK